MLLCTLSRQAVNTGLKLSRLYAISAHTGRIAASQPASGRASSAALNRLSACTPAPPSSSRSSSRSVSRRISTLCSAPGSTRGAAAAAAGGGTCPSGR